VSSSHQGMILSGRTFNDLPKTTPIPVGQQNENRRVLRSCAQPIVANPTSLGLRDFIRFDCRNHCPRI
jgi:hypothetical protein